MIWRFKAEMSWLPKSSESLTIRRSSRIFRTENVPTVRDFFLFHANNAAVFHALFFKEMNSFCVKTMTLSTHFRVVMQILCKWRDLKKNLNLIHLKLKRKKAGNEKWISDFFWWQRSATEIEKLAKWLSAHWRESGGGAGHVRGTSDPLHETHTHRTMNCYQNIAGLNWRSIAQLNWNLNLIWLKFKKLNFF
jgi:hypothetical protein